MVPQDAIISGATIGLMIAAPIGPMGILCIRRTLNNGFGAGLSTGAGASTVHFTYAGFALLGLQEAGAWMAAHRGSLGVLAAAIMLFFSVRTLRPRSAHRAAAGAAKRSLVANYASAVAFNSLNPMLLLLLAGAITSIIVPRQAAGGQLALLLLGVFLGSIAWWFALSGATAFVGARLDQRFVRAVDLSAGLAMAGFGVAALTRALAG